jgi:o-succinylbenzoate synthase
MPGLRIVGVTARTVRWPLDPRGAARGIWHERTAAILGVRSAALARAASPKGDTGLGEAAPLPGMSIDAIEDAITAFEALAAAVPFAIDTRAHATSIADRTTAAPAARFAIETALLAALAQHARTSIAALWAPIQHAELRNAVVVDDEADARAAGARGARCLKIKAATPEPVLRIAAAVPGVRLRVDANRSWPRADVEAWLAQLAGLPIDYVEEPCVDAHELLAWSLPCRIALDESLIGLDAAELARAVASPMLAALILKPTLLGGFARCHELAALAHRHGVAPIVTHALEGPIGTAACIELARSIGGDVPVGLAPHPALDQFFEAV